MPIELPITVGLEELDKPRTTIDAEGWRQTRRFKVAWPDRITAMQQLYGGQIDPESGQRVLPQRSPDLPFLFVRRVEEEPFDGVRGSGNPMYGTWTHSVLRVEYRSQQFDFSSPDSNNSWRWQATTGGEFRQLEYDEESGQALFWRGPTAQPNILADRNPPNGFVPKLQWSLTIPDISPIPAGIFSLEGTVNEDAIQSRYFPPRITGMAWLQETLRLDGIEASETEGRTGSPSWNITLRFSWVGEIDSRTTISGDVDHATWNHFYRDGFERPERLLISAGGQSTNEIYRLYPKKNFNAMFASLR